MQASTFGRLRPSLFPEHPVRFVFPDLNDVLPRLDNQAASGEAPASAELQFSELELARAAAAVQAATARQAHADAARLLEARLCQAVLALDERVTALAAARERDVALVKLAVRRLFGLFAATCLATVTGSRLADAMAGAVDRVLAEVPQASHAAVEVAPDMLDPMRALLAARAAGRSGLQLSVAARPDLVPGDVLMSWPDGWAEWSFERIGQSLRHELDLLPTPADGPNRPSSALPSADDAHPE